MNRCCLITLALLLFCLPALAVDVPALVAAAPGADQFPGDDIVVLYQSETIDVDADLRVTRHVHTVRRLQTQWAMRREADVRVAWDSRRQDLEVITARTFMTDGAVRETPANGFNEVTPDAVARAVPFLGLREMVITHIGIEPGCVVELEYVIRDREAGPLPAGGRLWLGGDHPVLAARAEVRGHASVTRAVGVDSDGGVAAAADLPAFEPDAVAPHLIWNAPADLDAGIRQATEAAAVAGRGLRDWLDGVRRDPDVLTSADLMGRVAALIHDEIAGVHLPTGSWSRAPRPAEDVFRSGVGTAWERAVVALALLREAGFVTELGLFVHPDRPARLPYSHLRVVAQAGSENWWLAPDRGHAWTGNCDLAGYTGVFLAADGATRSYEVPARPFACRWHVAISPADDGRWQAVADLAYDGLDGAVDDPRAMAEGLARRLLDGGTLADLELRESTPRSLSLRLRAEGEALAPARDGLVWYQLPWPDLKDLGSALAAIDGHRTERVGDLVLDADASVTATISLELPTGWVVDTRPDQEIGQTVGPFTLEHRATPAGNGLRLECYQALRPGTVTPAQWPQLRQALLQADALQERPVVILTGS